jgi:glycosyltransferase involved in cell wall biosynthesis
LPVVSTDLPGVSEVNHDGETGCIVPPGDTAALAQALAGLVENPGLRRSMGQAARERAETLYSSRVMGTKLDEIYTSLLGEKTQ